MKKQNTIIVDDENLTRKALIDGVRWEVLGIGEIFEASSVSTAQKILLEHKIDIALIDVEMPGENGIRLLEWIRNEMKSDMPCAFLTCHASFPYVQAAVRLNSFDYVLKPVDYLEVEKLILKMEGEVRFELEQKQMLEYGRQWLQEKTEEGRTYEKNIQDMDQIVEDLVIYIRSHLSEKLSLTDLAYRVGLSQNYLNKVFQNQTGETVNKFIIREKMGLGAKMLEEGKIKSYAISEFLGYDNYASFVNMFKKTFGVSPNAYRKDTQE